MSLPPPWYSWELTVWQENFILKTSIKWSNARLSPRGGGGGGWGGGGWGVTLIGAFVFSCNLLYCVLIIIIVEKLITHYYTNNKI